VVQHLLGHASISTTIDTYSHLGIEDARRDLVAAGVLRTLESMREFGILPGFAGIVVSDRYLADPADPVMGGPSCKVPVCERVAVLAKAQKAPAGEIMAAKLKDHPSVYLAF